MITRIWHGQTRPEDAEQYLTFLLGDGTREYVRTEGNLGAKVWRKEAENFCHFWTVSEWKDISSIKAFAGSEYEKAKYYPFDHDMLLDFEEKVSHYETFDVSAMRTREYIRQLQQLYKGGSWQGESFVDKLEDVGETQAFVEPVPGVHSIAEIVWHCIYWRTVVIKRFEGNNTFRDETVAEQNFLPAHKLRQRGWDELKGELEKTQKVLIGCLERSNDQALTKECEPGYTLDFHLEGLIHHDVYHLGQIGLVKKILQTRGL